MVRKPRYPSDSDYTTNAPSYYDDLARKNKLLKILGKKIYDYDKELAKRFEEWDKNLEDLPDDIKELLKQWIDDGTFAHIINDEIFKSKAGVDHIWHMENMGQDVKEAMTGGSVAVVGVNSVLEENIVDKQVTPIKLSEQKNTKNLFNFYKDPNIRGHFAGRVINISEESSNRFTYIECEPNTIYKISRKVPFYYFNIGYTTELPEDQTEILGYRSLTNTSHLQITFKTGADATHIVIMYYGSNEPLYTDKEIRKMIQVEKGSNFTKILPAVIPKVINESLEEETQYNMYHGLGLARDYIKSNHFDEVSPAGFGEVNFNIITSKIDDIYRRYDELLDTGYVEKKLEGYATNLLGENDFSLPIYKYKVYDNFNDLAGVRSNTLKIGIVSGIHGTEKGSVYSLYQFIKQMVKNKHDRLNQILSFVDLSIIPIANPWGYDNYARRNARGVDLNRNFSFNWETSTSSYKGEEPYSELESKLLKQWIEENDFDYVIDYHNTSLENAVYLISNNEEKRYIFSDFVKGMRFYWKKEYDIDVSKTTHHITNWLEGTDGTFAKDVEILTGKKISSILECPFENKGLRFKNDTMRLGVELIANLLHGMVKKRNM